MRRQTHAVAIGDNEKDKKEIRNQISDYHLVAQGQERPSLWAFKGESSARPTKTTHKFCTRSSAARKEIPKRGTEKADRDKLTRRLPLG